MPMEGPWRTPYLATRTPLKAKILHVSKHAIATAALPCPGLPCFGRPHLPSVPMPQRSGLQTQRRPEPLTYDAPPLPDR
jgi:hypothetical protein